MDSLDLPWLPEAPADYRAAVRALRQDKPVSRAALRRLSTARLDMGQLSMLARACNEAVAQQAAPVTTCRVLSNATVDLVVEAVAASAPRHGLLLDVSAGPYGSWVQEALDPASATRSGRPDVVLLALDDRAFDFAATAGDADTAQARVDRALADLLGAVDALTGAGVPLVIGQTLCATAPAQFGHLDAQVPGTRRWQVDAFNRALRQARRPGFVLLDVDALACTVGTQRWTDNALWNMAKMSVSARATPLYADHVCRLVMASRGLARKCLVLDLDNTVWGGVIGDDGLGGIHIGQGHPAAEAHLAVQQLALALRERGVVLAVSSKNDDAIARQPFREHPEMLLREDHIAVFQANWQDKASNLRAIAQALNIGVDALVLLDDNPTERHQVRAELPEVGVPELPAGPDDYAAILAAAGYFESVQFTDEDRQRAQQYQANAARQASLGDSSDLQGHLLSLQMEAHCAPFDAAGRARIVQLINKTNQFNLTTRRRTEAEVLALEQDPQAVTLQVRLKDRFGDNGMICVVIARHGPEGLDIDTWLMSCRVLNRRVEEAVLGLLVDAARRRGADRLLGHYLPTPKNGLVREHYARLGFTALGEPDATGASHWVLPLDAVQPVELPITVHLADAGPALPAGPLAAIPGPDGPP